MFESWLTAFSRPAAPPLPAEQPFDWLTPVAFEPDLLARLEAAHDSLHESLAELAAASEAQHNAEIARVGRKCLGQLQSLQRLEALRLYPVVTRSCAADSELTAQLAELRRQVYALGRRFMRLIEETVEEPETAWPASQMMLAVAMLARYTSEKQRCLYPLYAATAPTAA